MKFRWIKPWFGLITAIFITVLISGCQNETLIRSPTAITGVNFEAVYFDKTGVPIFMHPKRALQVDFPVVPGGFFGDQELPSPITDTGAVVNIVRKLDLSRFPTRIHSKIP